MPGLQTVRLQRFKRIKDAPFDLKKVNVLVGGNNSGKSSIIQGLHFGIALLQSIDLTNKSALEATSGTLSTSVNPNQLIYSPSEDAYALGPGGKLVESHTEAVSLELTLDNGEQVSVKVRKGRNRNVLVGVTNTKVAKALASLDAPFSIFSPGLAGIAKRENLVSDGVLYRMLARGDANLVLRNILWRLWNKPQWDGFLEDLHQVFPDAEFDFRFEDKTDEFLEVLIRAGSDWVPLELAGTGVLQTVQILSYIHRFSPSIIVLDEPDSHLHPNNQRLLCGLLRRVADERNTQILLTTHSRHVIDATGGDAAFFWVRNGTVDVSGPEDEIGILMDIGALDIKERATQPNTAAVVLTEDEITHPLECVLQASGFDLGRTAVMPYYGVTGLQQLRPLVKLIQANNPNAKIVVHRDRDFLTDVEVEQWKVDIRNLQAEPFVTKRRDIEGYFINGDHLLALNPGVDKTQIDAFIEQATNQSVALTVQDYVNGRIDVLRKAGKAGGINHGALAGEAPGIVAADVMRYMGKRALSAVRSVSAQALGKSLKTNGSSAHLADADLAAISKKIKPASAAVAKMVAGAKPA